MKKRFFFGILLTTLAWMGWNVAAVPDMSMVREGDLVFQTTRTSQSTAIVAASLSPYTHVGMVRERDGRLVVAEALATVRETPLDDWIAHGVGQRVAIYRHKTLNKEQLQAIALHAQRYYGKKYDLFFSFDNDEIYCSELPYLAYQHAGLTLGKVEKIADLYIGNPAVKGLIKERMAHYPACKIQHLNEHDCYAYILKQTLVTPASIARDSQLKLVFSNYPRF